MADHTLSPPPLPARPLARPSSRRSLRSLSSNQDDPLSSPSLADAEPVDSSPLGTAGAGAGGQYAVYSSAKKRPSGNPLSDSTTTASPPPPPSTSSSSIPTPPFHPTISLAPPPLVSRPSNSTLPSPSGRTYARSVSEAKEQLQKQALKAELQALGVQNDSWGAALVTKLAAIGDEGELSSVVQLVQSGKAVLLLPSEKLDFPSTIQTPHLLDHLIVPARRLTSPRDDEPVSFITLSGLRGKLATDNLVFEGSGLAVRPSDHGVVRQSALEPQVDYSSEDLHRYLRGQASSDPSESSSSNCPRIALASSASNLSLPRTASAPAAAVAAASRTNTSSRLAALFSKSVVAPPTTQTDASSSAVDAAGTTSTSKTLSNLDVPVLVIASPVRFTEITKQVYSAVGEELRSALNRIGGIKGDQTALDRVMTFSNRFQAPSPAWVNVYLPSAPASALGPPSSLFQADIETVSESFQDVLHSTRLDLSRNLSVASPTTPSSAADAAGSLEDFGALEERVDASLSEVEDVLLSTCLYPHVFSPPFSSDAQADENLASRIAALNVLELSLEHLGVELGNAEEGLPGWEHQKRGVRETVEDLADTVAKELARLENPSDRTASSKLEVFVQVHKILVDELGKLPPIPLKKEIEPSAGVADEYSHEVEMDDASSRSSSRAPSRPRSPTPMADIPEQTDDELLKTPRPPPVFDQEVPAIKLPEASASTGSRATTHELSSSMHEATSSSMFEPSYTAPSPPHSVFDTTARHRRSTSISSSSVHSSGVSPATSTSGADLILPLLIYSVVRSNPPRLISHLKFSHRFRSESLMRGQASYCLTNFDAVVEFLNHVDVSSLGLSSQKVLAAASPSPSLRPSSPSAAAATPARPRAYTTGRLSSRLTTEMPGLIDSANSALSGVVDSSYRMVFGPKGLAAIASGVGGAAPKSLDDVRGVLNGATRGGRIGLPTFGRSTSAATPAGDATRPRASTTTASTSTRSRLESVETGANRLGREMTDFPGSGEAQPSSPRTAQSRTLSPDTSPTKAKTATTTTSAAAAKDDDQRSIRSISSLIRDTTIGRTFGEFGASAVSSANHHPHDAGGTASGNGVEDRPSFGERLSSIPGLSRFSGVADAKPPGAAASGSSPSTRSSIFSAFGPTSSSIGSPRRPTTTTLAPGGPPPLVASTTSSTFEPVREFLEVESVDELRVGDVKRLLESYRELVAVWESEKEAALATQARLHEVESTIVTMTMTGSGTGPGTEREVEGGEEAGEV